MAGTFIAVLAEFITTKATGESTILSVPCRSVIHASPYLFLRQNETLKNNVSVEDLFQFIVSAISIHGHLALFLLGLCGEARYYGRKNVIGHSGSPRDRWDAEREEGPRKRHIFRIHATTDPFPLNRPHPQ